MLPPEIVTLIGIRNARDARYDRKKRLRHGVLTSTAYGAATRVLAKSPKISGVMGMVSCGFENRLNPIADGAG